MPYRNRKYGGSSDVLDYLSRRYGRGQQMRGLLDQFRLLRQLREERAMRGKALGNYNQDIWKR